MIRALIFDFDGLILDTEVPAYQSWQEVYESFGTSLPLADWATGIGGGQGSHIFDPCAFLEERVGRELDHEELRRRYRRRSDELVAAQAPRPGVVACLDEARERGLKLGVASSSPRSWVAGHLERLGLLDRFEALRCFGDAERTKPHPDLYLAVLEAFDISPAEAIAFEDSPNGTLAAKRAGLFCVAVVNPITAQLDLSHADLLVSSFEDLRLADLVEQGSNTELR